MNAKENLSAAFASTGYAWHGWRWVSGHVNPQGDPVINASHATEQEAKKRGKRLLAKARRRKARAKLADTLPTIFDGIPMDQPVDLSIPPEPRPYLPQHPDWTFTAESMPADRKPMNPNLTFAEYQAGALNLAIYPGHDSRGSHLPPYPVLGLVGEAGEVAEKAKKLMRDKAGILDLDTAEAIAHELGDVLWYAAAVAGHIGFSLSEIASMNLAKLHSRRDRGVLQGSGDAR
jgi:NTP pyrophosphatase (non-canonical NTP hydrolase)